MSDSCPIVLGYTMNEFSNVSYKLQLNMSELIDEKVLVILPL